MVDNTALKKQVLTDWQHAFPTLKPSGRNKLYKIVGPFVVGLELITLWSAPIYRPHFVIYPLWKPTAEECLAAPIILEEMLDARNLQLDIPYARHSTLFASAVESVRKQLPIPLERDVPLAELLAAVDRQFEVSPMRFSPGFQARLYELKIHAALWCGSRYHVENALWDLEEASGKWDMRLLDNAVAPFDVWLRGLNDAVGNRDQMIERIELNISDRRLRKLERSNLYEP